MNDFLRLCLVTEKIKGNVKERKQRVFSGIKEKVKEN